MPRTRSSELSADSPSQSARVLPESEVATSSELQPPVKDPVFVEKDESRPEVREQVQSAVSPPILAAKDFHLGSPFGLESSPSMPHLEPLER